MTVLVAGAGSLGGFLGLRLIASGRPVLFLEEPDRRKILQGAGLSLRSASGHCGIADPPFADLNQRVPPSAVLLCVKMGDLSGLLEALRSSLSRDTLLVTLQNGLDAIGLAEQIVSPAQVVGGIVHFAVEQQRPGQIRHIGDRAEITLGQRSGLVSKGLDDLAREFDHAGLTVTVSTDIGRDLWRKFVVFAALSGLTGVHRQAVGPALLRPGADAFLEALVGEATALGRASGADLPQGFEQAAIARVCALPPEEKSSMLVDLERGRRLELEWINGRLLRLGESLGIATPAHRTVVSALQPFAAGLPEGAS